MTMRFARTATGAGLLVAAGLLTVPAPAWAVGGTAQLAGGVLQITVDSSGDTVHLSDFGNSVRVGANKGMTLVGGGPCTQVNPQVVECPKASTSSYSLVGSGVADVVLADSMPLPGTIDLGGGNDYLQVGRGADDISGGAGFDEIAYNTRTDVVLVVLDGDDNDGEHTEGDNVGDDVERVFGGQDNDIFQGGATSTQWYGMGGDDIFYGSSGGPDRYDGGPGTDEFLGYLPAAGPVNLSLDDTANDGPAGQNDNLVGMEVLHGSSGADTITGDGGPNVLIGEGDNAADVLRGLGGDDVLFARGHLSTMDGGPGEDELRAYRGTGKQLIGGTGVDLVTYFGHTSWNNTFGDFNQSPVTVSINNQADDGYAGQKDKVYNDVENLTGTQSKNDTLTGSTGINVLSGLDGNDTLNGSGGNDVLIPQGNLNNPLIPDNDVISGGAGSDLVTYADETTAVAVSIDNKANDGPTGDSDNVKSDVEQVQGGSGNDTLSGGGAANSLFGGDGDDELRGNGGVDLLDGEGGADTMIGGFGADTASYINRTATVVVGVDNFANDGEAGEHDKVFTDIETVIGGEGHDELTGNSGANHLVGGNGDDGIDGGTGNDILDLGAGDDYAHAGTAKDGADKIIGGPGFDRIAYNNRTAPLTVTVNGSAGDGEAGENDFVQTDVEMVVGGAGNDKITGGAVRNILWGNGGNDILKGLGGDDLIDGGLGADEIVGGIGSDTVDYSERTADLFLTPDDLALDGESGEGDQIRPDVENFYGGSGDDFIIANFLDSTVYGGDGNDNITGGPGNDNLYGEGGNDWIEGEADTDFADGGPGIHDTCLTVESSVNCEHFS